MGRRILQRGLTVKSWVPEGVLGAIGKPPGRLRRGETLHKTEKARKHLSLASHKKSNFCRPSHSPQEVVPEGVQGATGKPPGRLRRGETLHKTKKARKHLSIASHKKPVPCGRFRPPAGGRGTFPHGKVPKGCRGRPKGACLMAAPGPPLLRNSAPLASQGRAQLGSHPFPGGPLSPSAQSIPPPAVGRRFIPGVVARNRHGRDALGQRCPGQCAMHKK